LKTQKSLGYYFDYDSIPSFFINERLVRGIAEGDIAAGAVCDSMVDPPITCNGIHLKALNKIHEKLDFTVKKRHEKFMRGIMFVVFLCILVFLFAICVFKRLANEQIANDLQKRAEYNIAMYHRVNDVDAHLPKNVDAENEMNTLPQ